MPSIMLLLCLRPDRLLIQVSESLQLRVVPVGKEKIVVQVRNQPRHRRTQWQWRGLCAAAAAVAQAEAAAVGRGWDWGAAQHSNKQERLRGGLHRDAGKDAPRAQ